jgi:hypothetical protein
MVVEELGVKDLEVDPIFVLPVLRNAEIGDVQPDRAFAKLDADPMRGKRRPSWSNQAARPFEGQPSRPLARQNGLGIEPQTYALRANLGVHLRAVEVRLRTGRKPVSSDH